MRTFVALTLYVSLLYPATPSAVPAATPETPNPEWMHTHERALAALDVPDLPEALVLFRKSAGLAVTSLEKGVSETDLGIALHHAGQDKEATPYLVGALAFWRALPAERIRAAAVSEALASAWRAQGLYPKSERLLRETLADPSLGSEPRGMLLNTLADIFREIGRSAESRALFQQAAALPGVSWRRILESKLGLADLDRDSRQWTDSLAEWNAAIALAEDHADHAGEAIALRGLGQTWLEQGVPARAEPLFRRALAVFETDPSTRNGNQAAATLGCIGQAYIAENKLGLAEEALTRALDGQEKALGAAHPQVAILHELLGESAARRGQMDLFRDHFNRAWRVIADTFGEDSLMAGAVLTSWATEEQRSGNPAGAAIHYQRALAIFSAADSPDTNLRTFVVEHYAQALRATHRKQEATDLLAGLKSFRGR